MALAVLLGLGSPVAAAPEPMSASEVRDRLNALDQRIAMISGQVQTVSEGYEAPLHRESGRLQRRLREAEIQAALGDHHRAAILLIDVAERPELRADPEYPEAMYLLAESLRLAGHPKSARHFYEELARTSRGERLDQVVLGLLEVASMTGDFSGVETHVRRLKAGSSSSERPRIDYAYGKALFRGAENDVSRLTQALSQFRSVPEGYSVSAPAAYYAGVTQVRMGGQQGLERAIGAFMKAKALAPSHPSSQTVQELASLSLGRIYQELGRIPEALDAYQGVAQTSPYFAEMLYEVAWTHVKEGEIAEGEEAQRAAYDRALDALELLTAAEPDSRYFPDARILQGNLQIRLGAPDTAYDTFQAVVDHFGSARSELGRVVTTHADTRQFFDELIEADLEDLGRSTMSLPSTVARMAFEAPTTEKAVEVRRALNQTNADLEEAREMVRTLEVALRGEQRFGMFPGLATARAQALTAQNELLSAELRLLDTERRMMVPYLSPASLARIEGAQSRAREVEKDIEALPTSLEDIEVAREHLERAYREVAQRAFQMLTQVRSMRAQLVASRVWMKSQGVVLSDGQAQLTEQRLERAMGEVEALESALEIIQAEVARAQVLSRGDGGWARAERLRGELYTAIDDQAAILRPERGGMPSELRGLGARVDQQRTGLRQLEQRLGTLQTRLEHVVDARVDEVRKRVLAELSTLQAQRQEYTELVGNADALLDPMAEATVEAVDEELRSLVLRADVGILDVAWARKRERSEKVTEMVRELRTREMELDEEFEQVLEDDQ